MLIEILKDYETLSRRACDEIVGQITAKPDTLLCPATGSSPLKTYEFLTEAYAAEPERFGQLRLVMLDEWYGVPPETEGTCYARLKKDLLEPLHINDDRFFGFTADAPNPENECQRMQETLARVGPIDLLILGIGLNGHLGFNEPEEFLTSDCHVARLQEKTRQHSMISGMAEKPQFGLTLGMGEILQAKKILLLINGSHKRDIARRLLEKQVSTQLPASFLWLHPNVTCFMDEAAAAV